MSVWQGIIMGEDRNRQRNLLKKEIEKYEEEWNLRFAEFEPKMYGLIEKMLEKRLEQVEQKLKGVENKLEGVEKIMANARKARVSERVEVAVLWLRRF
jgi:hypothetical protein